MSADSGFTPAAAHLENPELGPGLYESIIRPGEKVWVVDAVTNTLYAMYKS